MKKRKCNIKGVSWNSRYQKWAVQLLHKKKPYFGGYYSTVKEASLARQKLVEKHVPPVKPIALKVKKHNTRSTCRIMRCTDKCEGRGLCKKHYRYCSYHGLLEVYGVPQYRGRDRDYKINIRAGPYECRVIMDGEICSNKIYIRGLCHKHYNKYHRDGKLDRFALPAYANPKREIGMRDYDYDNN